MKPTPPAVPLAVWSGLYDAALEFHKLLPWKVLDDLDLVGVPGSSGIEPGYAAVMGSGGRLFGLCVYLGEEGLDVYRRLVSGEMDPSSEDTFGVQNCLKLELTRKGELLPEDHALVRRLGRSFGPHAWPEFRSLKPGYAPWFLNTAEAEFLTFAIRAVSRHCVKVADGELLESLHDDGCLTYSHKAGAPSEFEIDWKPFPAFKPAPISLPILNLARLDAIRARPLKRDSAWEVDVFYLPSIIYEGERPYFVRLAVVCQQSSGFTFGYEVVDPGTSPAQVLADTLCTSAERYGILPDVIFVREEQTAEALAPLCKSLGIVIRHKKDLDTVRSLRSELERRSMGGGGRSHSRKRRSKK